MKSDLVGKRFGRLVVLEEEISKLNDLGAGYSDQHGVAKKVIEANE